MKKTAKKTSKKTTPKKVAPPKRVKLVQAIGVKVGTLPSGKGHYENVLLQVSENSEGTEVEIPAKDLAYILDAHNRFVKAQGMMKKLLGE